MNLTEQLIQLEKGLVFLSAPTNAGKTCIIRQLKSSRENILVLSGEKFMESILESIRQDGKLDLVEEYRRYACVCIEDLDWYHGREYSQYEFARILSWLSETTAVIVTGIDLKKRLGHMFSKLAIYDYYEKAAADAPWLLQ